MKNDKQAEKPPITIEKQQYGFGYMLNTIHHQNIFTKMVDMASTKKAKPIDYVNEYSKMFLDNLKDAIDNKKDVVVLPANFAFGFATCDDIEIHLNFFKQLEELKEENEKLKNENQQQKGEIEKLKKQLNNNKNTPNDKNIEDNKHIDKVEVKNNVKKYKKIKNNKKHNIKAIDTALFYGGKEYHKARNKEAQNKKQNNKGLKK